MPSANANNAVNVEWHLDDVVLEPCSSILTPDFSFENIGTNNYQFYDQTTGSGQVVEWCWDFGDGTYSSLQNPTHQFQNAGPHNVCLTIRDAVGCHDKICKSIGDACTCGTATQVIQSNTTWASQSINLGNNLVVPTGVTLNIDASTVQVAAGCGITVQRGARLNVVNSSTLKAWCPEALWKGVTVLGNGFDPHPTSLPTGLLGAGSHGIVNAVNSTIRDAETAVGNSSIFFTSGGIIYADGVTFVHNRLGADIMPFPVTFGVIPQGLNFSRFLNCDFLMSPSSFPAISTAMGIRINGSQGILVSDCSFDALGNDAVTGTDYAASILGCDFTGIMPVAVRVQQSPSLFQTQDFAVENCTFNNTNTGFLQTSTGIVATGVTDLEVNHNTFNTSGVGANIVGPSGYFISDNDFNMATTGWFGMVLNQTVYGSGNRSERNRFGTEALGGTAIWGNNFGYEFNKETFNNGTPNDISMYPFSSNKAMIDIGQGAVGLPVYNRFLNNTDIASSTSTGLTELFFYFYPSQQTGAYPDLWPECDIQLENCSSTVGNNFDGIGTGDDPNNNNPDGCLNLPGIGTEGGGIIINLPDGGSMPGQVVPNIPNMGSTPGQNLFPNMSCETEACLPTIRSKIAYLEGLRDGGSTSSLLSAIQTAPGALNTKQALLNASPYLTDAVLLAMLANSSVPTANREEVLLANGPVSSTVLSAAQGNVSANTISQLQGMRTSQGVSSMEQLQILLADLYRTKYRATLAVAQYRLRQGNAATVDSMLVSDNTNWSNRLLVGLRLQTRNFTSAQSVLDALPSSTQSDQDYKYCQQINLYRLQDSSFVLSSSQEADLYAIANGATPEASYARALVTILTGVVFPPEVPESVEERAALGQTTNSNSLSEPTMTIAPNPSKEMVSITLPTENAGSTLEVHDLNGKLLISVVVTESSSVISTKELPSGIYLLTANKSGQRIYSKLVVQH